MNQIAINEQFFPTATQRKILHETDAELIGIIRRHADIDSFVASDVDEWARRLHAWPEVGTDQEAREQFVKERVESFVRLGVLGRAEKIIDGRRVKGFTLTPRTKKPSRNSSTGDHLTLSDRRFLRWCGTAW